MNTVIGLNDTPSVRAAQWRAMVDYRGGYKLYAGSANDWERRIANRSQLCYNNHLVDYIRKVA